MKSLEIYTDGACSGNPGPSGIGYIIRQNGKVVGEFSHFIGQATNNIAEYTALIYALQEALILKASDVEIRADSELLCRQVLGEYQVRHENIKPLFDQIQHLVKGFRSFRIKHVPRTENRDADRLAREGLKQGQAKVFASAQQAGEESPSSEG